MRIGILGKFLQDDAAGMAVFTALATQFNHHHFILFCDEHLAAANLPANLQLSPVCPGSGNAFVLKTWLSVRFPAILKKEQLDVLLSVNGFGKSNATLPYLTFITSWQTVKAHTALLSALQKTTGQLLVMQNEMQQQAAGFLQISPEEIMVTGWGAPAMYKPIEWEEKEAIKATFASDREFFLLAGQPLSAATITNVLKAFSLFKRRQLSNMQLLIPGQLPAGFVQKLDTYKFKNWVTVLENADAAMLPGLMAAAYGVICTATNEQLPFTAICAMQCGTAVITTGVNHMLANAALAVDGADHEALAEQLKMVYKDENQRSKLVTAGLQLTANYNIRAAADTLGNAIEKANRSM